jgi:hypothetical protein
MEFDICHIFNSHCIEMYVILRINNKDQWIHMKSTQRIGRKEIWQNLSHTMGECGRRTQIA